MKIVGSKTKGYKQEKSIVKPKKTKDTDKPKEEKGE